VLFGKKLPKVNGFVPVLIPFFEFDILAELIVNLGGLDADCAGYAGFFTTPVRDAFRRD
jgi:hypothetical protein